MYDDRQKKDKSTLPIHGEFSVKYVLDCAFHPYDYLFCMNPPHFCLHLLHARAKRSRDSFRQKHAQIAEVNKLETSTYDANLAFN